MLEQASDAIYCVRSALSEDDTCLLFMLTLRTAPSINHAHSEMIQIYNTAQKRTGKAWQAKFVLSMHKLCAEREGRSDGVCNGVGGGNR